MYDKEYCYENTGVLKNKYNITDAATLFEVEKNATAARLTYLENNPIKGNFDFKHLLKIHKYIFQDLYDWAGKIRTVEIGKGNLFCPTQNIISYGNSVFEKYYSQCFNVKDDFNRFIHVFAGNFADINALHPFREGNGRAQREFARELCLECGYIFDLSCTTHNEMLSASRLSFDKGDNSVLEEIFDNAVIPIDKYQGKEEFYLSILSSNEPKLTNLLIFQ